MSNDNELDGSKFEPSSTLDFSFLNPDHLFKLVMMNEQKNLQIVAFRFGFRFDERIRFRFGGRKRFRNARRD
jgi:hypothetical protein